MRVAQSLMRSESRNPPLSTLPLLFQSPCGLYVVPMKVFTPCIFALITSGQMFALAASPSEPIVRRTIDKPSPSSVSNSASATASLMLPFQGRLMPNPAIICLGSPRSITTPVGPPPLLPPAPPLPALPPLPELPPAPLVTAPASPPAPPAPLSPPGELVLPAEPPRPPLVSPLSPPLVTLEPALLPLPAAPPLAPLPPELAPLLPDAPLFPPVAPLPAAPGTRW